MSKESVEIYLSNQAELLLKEMPEIKKENVIKWFADVRRISIGGGDICDYLKHLKEEEKKKGELSG